MASSTNLRGASAASGMASSRPVMVALLMIAFILPFYFYLGSLRLSVYRTLLILLFLPTFFWWISGAAGRLRAIDGFVILFALWSALALLYNHGFARWELVGVKIVETLGPYLVARTLIRDASAFRFFSLWFLIVVVVMLPAGIFQNFTNRPILLEIFGKFLTVYNPTIYDEPRLGFFRAQSSMPHPILFGVFCAPAFGLAWYVLGYGRSTTYRLSRAGLVAATVFTSLSSGAWLAVAVQIALGIWRKVFNFMQQRWRLLIGLFVFQYLFIETFSNRSPAQIFARYLTLQSSTAWNRINIFNNATDDVMRSPIFGIGLGDWTRPRFMQSSIDNFWLVMALRHGLPAFIFLLVALVLIFVQIGRVPLTGRLAQYRLGYLFSLAGLSIAAITVHLWDASYCLLMFMLGSGIWMLDATDEDGEGTAKPVHRERRIRYTRFE